MRPTVSIDPSGTVFVADEGQHRVVTLTAGGDSIASVGSMGWGTEQFDDPVAIASRGLDVYVADRNNHRVQRYTRDLTLISSLSTRELRGPSAFGYPAGVALSPEGDMFVTDGENKRILKFNAFGKYIRSFGGLDGSPFLLHEPTQVATTADGFVFVLDRGKVASFDALGTPRGWVALPDGARAIASDGMRLFALLEGRAIVVHPVASPVPVALPSGEWRSIAVRANTIVLGGATEVRLIVTN
jgi:DNA-binding beta-propeller fold protein YncE